jgi:hypothetical protein
VVRVYIDRRDQRDAEESVSIEDCEQVNREMSYDSRRRGSAALHIHLGGVVARLRSPLRDPETTSASRTTGEESW